MIHLLNLLAAIALLVWSAMTALSGLAQSFTHIALARLGVGLGEAGGTPPAHSIISDLFPPERRGSALSTYALGVSIGGALGLLLGGWLEEWIGWRWTFAAVGLPGIALALVVRLTLREPPRVHAAGRGSLFAGFAFMATRRSFVHMASGAALLAFSGYGTGAFSAVFLERVHHLSTGEVGSWLGGIALGAGAHVRCMGKGRKERATPISKDSIKLLRKPLVIQKKAPIPSTDPGAPQPATTTTVEGPASERIQRKHAEKRKATAGDVNLPEIAQPPPSVHPSVQERPPTSRAVPPTTRTPPATGTPPGSSCSC